MLQDASTSTFFVNPARLSGETRILFDLLGFESVCLFFPCECAPLFYSMSNGISYDIIRIIGIWDGSSHPYYYHYFLGKNLHQLAASGTMGGPAEVKAEPRAEPRAEPWAEPRWFRSSKPVEISGIRGPCPPLFEVPMALPMRSDAKLVT